MLVYKVLRAQEWSDFLTAGSTLGSPADLIDGFVHLSTEEQLAGTLKQHFGFETNLFLVAIDAGAVGAALNWEPSRSGHLYPHLYRPLLMEDVIWCRPLDESPVLPETQA
ncbi:MAG: DUF952 domain-containing protein [Pseudomonadota bacterium]